MNLVTRVSNFPHGECQKGSFGALIIGYERDCVNTYCEYTGRMYGYFWTPFKRSQPHVKIEHCVYLTAFQCYQKDLKVCEDEDLWYDFCNVWTVCPRAEHCFSSSTGFLENRCSCYKGPPYRFALNRMRSMHSRWFRLIFLYGNNTFIAQSNTFNRQIEPENWNPLSPQPSTAGHHRMQAESTLVQMSAVFAVLLSITICLQSSEGNSGLAMFENNPN
ncbi:uncharacterized protein LOC131930965 [Physella acuta]|uniref:uncharacterized protein LOC131930965 n=1 Tax=Physella acuta TaxID=109671 RepID=UPI0027DCE8B9|nr:uncharacterized protein LOC131930965 [Physella acuta]